jgi:RHS repeat-associated protein
MRFDPWGKRECAVMTTPLSTTGTISSWGSCSASANEERGFTGHEMLDELGFIHMNGRLYDPITGRFLQADPIIQSAYDGQNYNRYSYVMNNPLSYTDPTGFSWWTKWRRPLLAIAAAITMQYYIMPSLLAGTSLGVCGINYAAGNAISAMASGFAAGGISGGQYSICIARRIYRGIDFRSW